MTVTANLLLFVSCAPKLELLLAEELRELGVAKTRVGSGGVHVSDCDWSTIYKINYGSRLADSVLLPLSRFLVHDQESLYQNILKMNWAAFIKDKRSFFLDADVQNRKLRNTAAQIAKDAICEQVHQKTGRRPVVDIANPDIQLHLSIQESAGVISFDTSGAPLHKRGYRVEGLEAPIQESLAAAILRIAKYNKDQILLDPCCGTGTILIEAAFIATNTPPGYFRQRWGFMRHPSFKMEEWLSVKNQLDEKRTALLPNHLFGLDISKNAIRAGKINLRTAGVSTVVEIVQGDLKRFTPTIPPTMVVTNPPYAKSLEEETHLGPLYRALGLFLKLRTAKPSKGFIFTGNLELSNEVGLEARQTYILGMGGMDAHLLEYDL